MRRLRSRHKIQWRDRVVVGSCIKGKVILEGPTRHSTTRIHGVDRPKRFNIPIRSKKKNYLKFSSPEGE